MQRHKLEAVAECITHYSGYLKPESALYAGRNPGGLVAFASQPKDAQGFRTFRSVLDGMQALIFDVQLKMTGKARTVLLPSATLADFAQAYGHPAAAAVAWSSFLRKALHDQTISHKTEISYFLGDNDVL